jgi:hypothetical protein
MWKATHGKYTMSFLKNGTSNDAYGIFEQYLEYKNTLNAMSDMTGGLR